MAPDLMLGANAEHQDDKIGQVSVKITAGCKTLAAPSPPQLAKMGAVFELMSATVIPLPNAGARKHRVDDPSPIDAAIFGVCLTPSAAIIREYQSRQSAGRSTIRATDRGM